MARQTGWPQRTSTLTGAAFAQTLIFGWLNDPDATLAQLAQMAATAQVTISPQGLDQRFTKQAAKFLHRLLEAVVAQMVSTEPTVSPVLQRFAGVCIMDSSMIAVPEALMTVWPGCTGAALKIQVHLDLLTGALRGPVLQAGRVHDRGAPGQTDFLPGALRLADLGYVHLETFARLSVAHCFWLSRLHAQVHVYAPDGRPLVLEERLAGQAAADFSVGLGALRLPARLIAIAVPDAVAEERRQHLRKKAQRHGKPANARQLALAAWTILVTNVPAARLSPPEALVLARLRWQIELLFKLWKDLGKLDESRSHQPWRQLCEGYAKLIVQVIQHWLLLISCWQFPDRSLRQAAQTIRRFATSLLLTLPHRKKGTKSAGVKRQYRGTAGRVENCQIGVFLAYSTDQGHVLLDRALYLPKEWADDPARREDAGIPSTIPFATKPQLAQQLLARAQAAHVPFAWVTGDEVYGGDRALRVWLEAQAIPFVLAIRKNEPLWMPGFQQVAAETVVADVPTDAWQRLSAGQGAKGPRWYDWVRVRLGRWPTPGWEHWLLGRRSRQEPHEIAYYLVFAPTGTLLETLVAVAGRRWTVEESIELAKGEVGLDQYEVRHWVGWYRHITLAMLALAYLTVIHAWAGAHDQKAGLKTSPSCQ